MLTSLEFKKQIGKVLSAQFRTLGFKGSGFSYVMESGQYVYIIGIQASSYGGQCYVEFGIQPCILKKSNGEDVAVRKLKFNECEFRTRLNRIDGSQAWTYSEDKDSNIATANNIIEGVKLMFMPIIYKFDSDPKLFESIEVNDLDHISSKVGYKLGGLRLMTTDLRLAWAITVILENSNLTKAKEFAEFGLSKLDGDSSFFGKSDFLRVIEKSNGA